MINKTTTPPALPISSDSFERLRTSIKGDMVLPSDPTYNEAIVRWSACGQKAGIVVFPKDEEDIIMVLEVVLREKVDLALKGEYINIFVIEDGVRGCTHSSVHTSRKMNALSMGVEYSEMTTVCYLAGDPYNSI